MAAQRDPGLWQGKGGSPSAEQEVRTPPARTRGIEKLASARASGQSVRGQRHGASILLLTLLQRLARNFLRAAEGTDRLCDTGVSFSFACRRARVLFEERR